MFSPLIAATLLLTLIVTAYLYVKMCYSYWTRKGLPFLPPTFPFGNFGDSFLQKKSIPENVRSVYNSSDAPIVGVYMGLRPVAVIRDPKVIQNMLVKDSASFSHRGINVNENVDSMVASLFLQNGDKWKEMRRLLSPAFTTGRLKEMFETIVKCGDSLYEHVDRFAENGQPIEIAEVLACFTNNIIASVSFGIDIDCIKNPKSDFRKYAGRIFESNVTNGFRGIVSLASWTLTKMLRLRFVDKEVRTFMVDLVRQNMEYREQNNVIRKDIFQLMMQVRNTGQVQNEGDWNIKSTGGKAAMSLNEMAGQSFAFYSAGYVSSATKMSFCMYELAKNQHIQQKLYENISSALKLHDGKLTYDSLNEMKYLANCIEGESIVFLLSSIGDILRISYFLLMRVVLESQQKKWEFILAKTFLCLYLGINILSSVR